MGWPERSQCEPERARLMTDFTKFNKEEIERALYLIWHYSEGMKVAGKKPVNNANKDRICRDVKAFESLVEFTESNIKAIWG
jgi:hypothetical protein